MVVNLKIASLLVHIILNISRIDLFFLVKKEKNFPFTHKQIRVFKLLSQNSGRSKKIRIECVGSF